MERRKFLRGLLVVPLAPVVFRGVSWGESTDPEPERALESQIAVTDVAEVQNPPLIPSGTILPYAGREVPPGFLPCDGRVVQPSEYPALHAAIGYAYGIHPYEHGVPSGFRLPDLRSTFPSHSHTVNPVQHHPVPGYTTTISRNDHVHSIVQTPLFPIPTQFVIKT